MPSQNVTRGYGLLERYLAKKRARKANELIPHAYRKGRILDIGSGAYPFFLLTTRFFEKFGIDRTFFFAPQDRRGDHHPTLVHHDIESEDPLPFSGEYFDVVTMLAVFEHIDPVRLPIVFQDVNRVLKKGGILIITTPASWTGFILKGMAMARLVSTLEIGEHKGLHSPESIVETLRRGGFPSERVCLGHFEFYMNTWATAQK